MMKKTLILLLVFGLVSIANATVTMELREADGVTPVADLANGVYEGSAYVLVVEGASADKGASIGIYGPAYTAADWDNLGSGGQSAAAVLDTGDMSYILWNEGYQGYDMVVDDSGSGPGVSTGDWFTVDLSGLLAGDFAFDLLDYKAGSTVISSVAGTVTVPEPMTIALLGLGGLFLRRRK
jgi:hypothetical protein